MTIGMGCIAIHIYRPKRHGSESCPGRGRMKEMYITDRLSAGGRDAMIRARCLDGGSLAWHCVPE